MKLYLSKPSKAVECSIIPLSYISKASNEVTASSFRRFEGSNSIIYFVLYGGPSVWLELSLSSHLSGYFHKPKLGSNDACIYEINRINCTCPSSLPKVSNLVFVLLFSYSIVGKVEWL